MAKDSHLRTYLEVHSLNSDQVFLSIQFKTFPVGGRSAMDLNFSAFELYHSSFHILTIKSSYRVVQALSNFLFNSFEILQLVIRI